MKNVVRRGLAWLLSMLMLLSCLPTTAFAAVVPVEKTVTTTSGSASPSDAMLPMPASVDPVGEDVYITFEFKNGDTTVSRQIVKDGGTVYQPSTPEVPEGKKFLGWYSGKTEFAFGPQDLSGYTESATVTVNAKFSDVYYAYFMTLDGQVYKTLEATEANNFTITAPRDYEPAGKRVTNWTSSAASVAPNADVMLSVDTTFTPETVDCVWVSYETNGAGAVASQYADKGSTVALSTAQLTREGYTFGGWTLTEGSTTAVTSISNIQNDTLVYAIWTPAPVTFTVVYWGENADDTGYSPLATASGTAETGDSVFSSNYSTLPTSVTDRAYYTLYTKKAETVKILADGSSVLNVYFNRNTYTLTFKNENSTVATITAKYNAEISGEFRKAPFNTTYNGRAWKCTETSKYSYALQTLDRMPGFDATFNLYNQSSQTKKTISYYVQKVGTNVSANTWPTSTTNFDLLKKVDTYFNFATYDEEYHEIQGFTRYSARVAGFSNNEKSFSRDALTLYYLRNSYTLTYNNYGTETTATVQYGTAMSSYKTDPKRPSGFSENAVFKGWYTVDPSNVTDAETQKYDFANKTMPAGDLILYALWEEPELAVTLTANVEIPDSDNTLYLTIPYGTSIKDNEDYDDFVSKISDRYVILKWVNVDTGETFDVSTRLYADTNIRAVIKGINYEVTYDLGGGTGTAPKDAHKYEDDAEAKTLAFPADAAAPKGKVFVYWQSTDASTGTTTRYYPGQSIRMVKSVILTAVYADIASTVSVTYHSNFGETEETKVAEEGTPANGTITVLTYENTGFTDRAGYTFQGWATSTDGEVAFAGGASARLTVGDDNHLYAVWTANTDTKYNVQFYHQNANGTYYLNQTVEREGTTDTTVSVTEADKASREENKYVFEADNENNVLSGTIAGDGSLVLKLYFKLNTAEYTIHHYLKGTETKVADDQTGTAVIGTTLTGKKSEELYTEYANASVDSTQTIMIAADESKNVITVYYTMPLTLKANDASKTYDGKALTESGFTATGLLAGDSVDHIKLSMTAESTITDAGTQPNAIDTTTVEEVPPYYSVTYQDGTLKVTPRPVKFTGESATIEYDGQTHTLMNVTADNLVEGHTYEGLTYSASGKNVGTYNGTIDSEGLTVKDASGIDVTKNYTFSYEPGKLTIEAGDITKYVTLTPVDVTKTYDGKTYAAGTATAVDVNGNTLTVEYSVDGYNWTTDPSEITAKNVADTKPISVRVSGENYAGYVVGKEHITITQREVTLTSATDTKEYDGKPLTNATVTVGGDGFADGEGATYNVTGTQTLVGESDNAFTYALTAVTLRDNYNFTKTEGKLTVTGDKVQPNKTTEEVESNYKLGDTIPFVITIENVSTVEVTEITVVDENAIIVAGEGYDVSADGHTATIAALASGGVVTIHANHVVTQEDILAGKVGNTAHVSWKDGEKTVDKDASKETTDIEEPDIQLDLQKKSDYDGKQILPGLSDKITYTITLKNTGNVDYPNVTVADVMDNDDGGSRKVSNITVSGLEESEYSIDAENATVTIPLLKRDVEVTITAEYTVTEADIHATEIVNTVNVTIPPIAYKDHEGNETKTDEKKSTDTWTDNVAAATKGLSITKVATGSKTDYAAGDVVYYDVTVANAGNTTLSGDDTKMTVETISVSEHLADAKIVADTHDPAYYTVNADGTEATIKELKPYTSEEGAEGENYVVVKVQYTVTEEDVLSGKIVNEVAAAAEDVDPVDAREEVATKAAKYDLSIEKTIENAPADGVFKYGDEIQYALNVAAPASNSISISNVIVKDVLLTKANEEAGIIALTLPEGATKTYDAAGNIVITLPDTAAGAKYAQTVLYTYTVQESDLGTTEAFGSIGNTATVTGELPKATDPEKQPENPSGTSSQEATTEKAQAKVRYVKTSADSTKKYALGETIQYTIVVTNSGNVTLNDVTVQDDLAAAVIKEGAGYTVEENIARIAALAPNASVTVNVEYTVTSDDIKFGKVVNSATISSEEDPDPDPKPSDDETEDLNTKLKVTKTSDKDGEKVALGETITYTITVKNEGNVPFANVKVDDALTNLHETIEVLEVGDEKTFTTTYVVTSDDILKGSILNSATAKGDDVPDPKDPETPKTPEGGDETTDETDDVDTTLTVTKTSDKEGMNVALGETITYTITVKNDGNVPFYNVKVDDELTNLHESIGTLAAGKEKVFTTTYVVTSDDIKAGKILNSVTAKGDDVIDPKNPETPKTPEGGDETTDDTGSLNTKLTVTKTSDKDGQEVKRGETITYTITVKNDGNVPYTNVEVDDKLTGLHEVIATLAVGEEKTFTTSYKVTSDDILNGKVLNSATAKADPIDDPDHPGETKTPEGKGETTDETVDVDVKLDVIKESDKEGWMVSYRELITYTIIVRNMGNVPYYNVVVDDELTGLHVVIDELAVGDLRKFETTYGVTSDDILNGSVLNVATAKGDPIPDPKDPENPKIPEGKGEWTDEADDVITTLKVFKYSDKDGAKVALGETINYRIIVLSEGNVPYYNVKVDDDLTGLHETIDVLEVGEEEIFTTTYTVTIDDILKGSILNSVTAKGDEIIDPKRPDNPKTPEGSAEKTDEPDDLDTTITVTKTSDKDGAKVTLGETITYTIVVKNDGNVPFYNVNVDDELTNLHETIEVLKVGEEKTFTTTYTVTSDDIINGSVLNSATAKGDEIPDPKDPENPKTPEGEGEQTDETEALDVTLTVTKTSDVKTGEQAKLGQTVNYTITVTNDGNVPYTNVVVNDPLTQKEWTIDKLPVGETRTFTTSYVINEDNIALLGQVTNVATAKGDPIPDPADKEHPKTPEGSDVVNVVTEPLDVTLTVTKTSDKEGETVNLDDVITYTITVKNDGNHTYYNVKVDDELTNLHETIEVLAVGEEKEFTTTYVVTEADVLAGKIINSVTAKADPIKQREGEQTPEGGAETVDETKDPAVALDMVKSVTSEPENGSAYKLGEKITYTITVTAPASNTVTVENVIVSDTLITEENLNNKIVDTGDAKIIDTADGKAVDLGDMAPNTTVSFTYTYTVQASDLGSEGKLGSVKNAATVTGTTPVPTDPDVPKPDDPKDEGNTDTPTTIALTITAIDGEYDYDGQPHGENGYTVEGLREGDNLTVTIDGTETLVGVYEDKLVPKNATIADGDGKDVTDLYEITYVPGDLTIKGNELIPDKEITNEPIESNYKLGDRIEFTIEVKNVSSYEITDATVHDANAVLVDGTGYTVRDVNWAEIPSIPAGTSVTLSAYHIVTSDDILAGKVGNKAWVGWYSGDVLLDAEDEVETDKIESPDTTLEVKKTSDHEGKTVELGETITYQIDVTNKGNVPFYKVEVNDELTGMKETIAMLGVGETVTFTTTYVVTSDDIKAGKILNSATAKGDEIPDPKDPENPKTPEGEDETTDKTDDLDTTLTVTKTSDKDGKKVELGETITYTITVKNEGNVPFTNVKVDDELTNLHETIDELAVGAEKEFTTEYVVTSDDIKAGSILNSATAKGDDVPDPKDPENPRTPEGGAETTDETEDLDTKLTVTKTSDKDGKKVALGEKITYTIIVKNEGNVPFYDVNVDDELTNLHENIAVLAVGAEKEFTTEYVVTSDDIKAGKVLNSVTAKGDEIPDPKDPENPKTPEGEGEKTDETEDLNAKLTVTKVSDKDGKKVALGEKITYTITVKNEGNVPFYNVDVDDDLTNLHENIAVLAVGAEKEFTTEYTVTSADILNGKVLNSVTAKGDEIPDPKDPENPKTPEGEGEKTDETDDLNTKLKVTKTSDKEGESVALGDTITYTITVKNEGNVPFYNVKVDDELTNLHESIAVLAVGAEKEFTTDYVVTSDDIKAGKILNSATAKGDEIPDPKDPENPKTPEGGAETTDETGSLNTKLTVTKVSDKDGKKVALGEKITYTITVKNEGNVPYTNVEVDDALTNLHETIDELAVGAEREFTTEYVVTSDDILNGKVLNSATAKADPIDDPDRPGETKTPEGEAETVDETDDLNARLTVTKVSDKDGKKVALGEKITYTITVKNEGNVPFYNVDVDDDLTGMHANIDELKVGAEKEFTTEYTVTSADILNGNVLNSVTAKGNEIPDPKDPENPKIPEGEGEKTDETDDLDTTLTVTKTSDKGGAKVELGETITYTITVKNDGNVSFFNVKVDDELTNLHETIAELPVGAKRTFTTTYTVTSDDVKAGKVLNSATAKGDEIPDPKDTENPKTPEGKDETTDGTGDLNTKLTVTKTSDKKGKVNIGDVITYTITVKNEGNVPFTNVKTVDTMDLTGDKDRKVTITKVEGTTDYTTEGTTVTINTLAVGQTVTITATYTVTEADVLNGKVLNNATAAGDEIPDPKDPEDPKKPEGKDETENDTDAPKADITVEKTVENTKANGKPFALGDKIEYKLTITTPETNNVTVEDVKVTDALLTKANEAALDITLPEGASKEYDGDNIVIKLADIPTGANIVIVTYTYTVQKSDLGADGQYGNIHNAATVTGTTPEPTDKEVVKPDDPTDTDETDSKTAIPVIITAKDVTGEYDGTKHTATGLDGITSGTLQPGHEIKEVEYDGGQIHAGDYEDEIVPTKVIIRDADGNDVTDHYEITFEPGDLTITKRDLTITAGSYEGDYDAKWHDVGYTVDNLAETDKITALQMKDGKEIVPCELTPDFLPETLKITHENGEDSTNDYNVTYVPGSLIIHSVIVKYRVKYFYDGVYAKGEDEKGKGDVLTQITDYYGKRKEGWKLDRVENLPLTLGLNEEENVIYVYYVHIPLTGFLGAYNVGDCIE